MEERTGTLTTLERQFVWGLRYIDNLVMRDRSTANNGVINERRYAMQDDNWNTVAICDITGFVSERYAYSHAVNFEIRRAAGKLKLYHALQTALLNVVGTILYQQLRAADAFVSGSQRQRE